MWLISSGELRHHFFHEFPAGNKNIQPTCSKKIPCYRCLRRDSTPLKINMEPKQTTKLFAKVNLDSFFKHTIEKKHHLPHLHVLCSKCECSNCWKTGTDLLRPSDVLAARTGGHPTYRTLVRSAPIPRGWWMKNGMLGSPFFWVKESWIYCEVFFSYIFSMILNVTLYIEMMLSSCWSTL